MKTLHSQSESPAARAGGSSDALLQHASSSSKKFPHNILLAGKTRRGSERRVFAPEILHRARNEGRIFFFPLVFPHCFKFFFFLFSDSRTPDLFDIFAAALQMIKLLTLRGLSNQEASLLPDTVNHSV